MKATKNKSEMGEELEQHSEGWFSRNKKRVAGALVTGSVAMGIPHVVDNWDELWTRGVGYGIAYTVFGSLYLAGGAVKSAGMAKRGVSRAANKNQDEINKPYDSENAGLIVNGIGAVGMGATALGATVALLPAKSWPLPVAAAAIDIVASVWSRATLIESKPDSQEKGKNSQIDV
ncbi:MAG: hypothetical protein H6799_03540 [Candidatus Nomurabacteria bacterium]|nr:MAG: hypothetical protein H6799_03540 [Candidatus Nomurabacteria bacterium]